MQSCLLTPFKGVNTKAIGLTRSFLIAHTGVRHSPLYYVLLLLLSTIVLNYHYEPNWFQYSSLKFQLETIVNWDKPERVPQ